MDFKFYNGTRNKKVILVWFIVIWGFTLHYLSSTLLWLTRFAKCRGAYYLFYIPPTLHFACNIQAKCNVVFPLVISRGIQWAIKRKRQVVDLASSTTVELHNDEYKWDTRNLIIGPQKWDGWSKFEKGDVADSRRMQRTSFSTEAQWDICSIYAHFHQRNFNLDSTYSLSFSNL